METIDGNLSVGMRHINGVYTQQFNRTHHRVGHLFQGRFKSVLVDQNSYLLELCRYIVLNPVRAGMVELPEGFVWSSYCATAGACSTPAFLETDWILAQFARRKDEARKQYIDFVRTGIGKQNVWAELKSQCILGGEKFLAEIEPAIKDKSLVKEIPRCQRFIATSHNN